ncbi:MICOS complex subunit MIC19 [Caenorhabditis elegans]|uniref:MICOS complex subunit MIC19 n=1 Tax=Caenorhabditis elegans TaxID=6239 RepID=CHCH3_CAEEL|nr:MICOS complex subunit MIC19 [Caenorhabditis elegans]Q21551.1 RecName: Full=MICOS complex subunit MIC19; AltName: Full=Coiled-coil-helix-coiled-coil-helix domain-containing protein 3 [Caenorhabditis elegans]CAB01650.1 MICOS complex subunit MIC19 [Caenorhabditis elegans]|eukprot:NP_496012.1 MICOS complex subunit MIC19 [Caenorhabditis elegans]
MGASQSAEQEARPEVVRIDRNEIPEEYKTVGVSSDVVSRVNATRVAGNDGESDRLRQELAREREEKARLREDMAKLSQLQQRKTAGISAAPVSISGNDLEERKKIFDDTVERVQKQFFAYHRENVCQDNENEIVRCLQENPGRVLKCAPLTEAFEKCVGEFRQQVLKGN